MPCHRPTGRRSWSSGRLEPDHGTVLEAFFWEIFPSAEPVAASAVQTRRRLPDWAPAYEAASRDRTRRSRGLLWSVCLDCLAPSGLLFAGAQPEPAETAAHGAYVRYGVLSSGRCPPGRQPAWLYFVHAPYLPVHTPNVRSMFEAQSTYLAYVHMAAGATRPVLQDSAGTIDLRMRLAVCARDGATPDLAMSHAAAGMALPAPSRRRLSSPRLPRPRGCLTSVGRPGGSPHLLCHPARERAREPMVARARLPVSRTRTTADYRRSTYYTYNTGRQREPAAACSRFS